jgi:hypothetical protein
VSQKTVGQRRSEHQEQQARLGGGADEVAAKRLFDPIIDLRDRIHTLFCLCPSSHARTYQGHENPKRNMIDHWFDYIEAVCFLMSA